MDFNDTPEEAAYRAEVRQWLKENATNLKLSVTEDLYTEEDIEQGRKWQAKKAEAGYTAITWPKEYGGMGGTPMQAVIYDQEESRYPAPFNYFSIAYGQAIPPLITYGTEEQKRKLIEPTIKGELIWCQLFSEPSAGVDLAAVRCKAVRDGDEWVINGQKIWNSGAHKADWGILIARTDPTVPKHKGLSYFVLDMKTPGITIEPIKQISGHDEFCSVFFDDVRLPADAIVGEPGQGWRVAMTSLVEERFKRINMRMPSTSQFVDLMYDVEVDGKPAIEDSATSDQIADFLVKKCSLECFMSRMLTKLSCGAELGPESTVLKLRKAKLAQDMATFAMDISETQGLIGKGEHAPTDGGFLDGYLWLPAIRIAGGSDEVLRNIIGERVLGLPQAPRPDKGKAFNELEDL